MLLLGLRGLWWTSVLNSALPPKRLRPDTWLEHQDPVSHTVQKKGEKRKERKKERERERKRESEKGRKEEKERKRKLLKLKIKKILKIK